MSSSESGLPDVDDPMAIGSGESDPEMMPDDNDDFQLFALPTMGDDTLTTDGIPDEDPFVISIPVHDHVIIDHPDDEHDVTPILASVPLVVVPLEGLPFDDLIDVDVDLLIDGPFDDTYDSFESVTSSALQAVGLRRSATDVVDDTAITAAVSPLHELGPGLEPDLFLDDQPVATPGDPKPFPDRNPIPFGILDIAPLIPDLAPATIDPSVIGTFISPPAPTHIDAAPYSVKSDAHRIGLPINFMQNIPAPRPGKDTSGHQTSQDIHVLLFTHSPVYTLCSFYFFTN
ncbi:hypothetical protein Hanom_Chr06g00539791 [Helianthus anomalus]